jgi:hypothetical protein
LAAGDLAEVKLRDVEAVDDGIDKGALSVLIPDVGMMV